MKDCFNKLNKNSPQVLPFKAPNDKSALPKPKKGAKKQENSLHESPT
jgi:hypothetical protein